MTKRMQGLGLPAAQAGPGTGGCKRPGEPKEEARASGESGGEPGVEACAWQNRDRILNIVASSGLGSGLPSLQGNPAPSRGLAFQLELKGRPQIGTARSHFLAEQR